MDNVHNKMMSVHKMTGQLEIEAGQLPAATEFFEANNTARGILSYHSLNLLVSHFPQYNSDL